MNWDIYTYTINKYTYIEINNKKIILNNSFQVTDLTYWLSKQKKDIFWLQNA